MSSAPQQQQLHRQVLAYRPTNQIFLQKERNYIQQYSHIYLKRLLALRPGLTKFLKESRTGEAVAEKVIALKIGERCAVIGTLYKDQKLKPNILDEFTNDFGAVPKQALDNYCAEDDALLLEDESGRCTLFGTGEGWKDQVSLLVSGIVCACVGTLNDAGVFVVDRIVFPGDAVPRSIKSAKSEENSPGNSKRYMLLTSGLYAGSVSENNSLSLQLLIDYVAGHLDPAIGSSIARMVIAGGAICPPSRASDAFKDLTIDAKLTQDTQEILVESLRAADRWFAELAACVPVDVMPGEHDPCNVSLPQQPLHHCLFPNAARLSANSFKCVTNPHSFALGNGDDLHVWGHSGQPVTDALHYMKPGTRPVDFLEASLLKYRHLAPTAPDTLACYPFFDRDPFVVEKDQCRLLFAGGCPSFETTFSSGTRFVCVPSFRDTKQVVMVDLDSPQLDCSLVTFDIRI